jgi:5'-3' exoribonuclease 1
MEYIRYRKSLPDWDANSTHCMYGLDADLIMLGLVTHEPHFALLREDVLNRRKGQPEQFHLLHLGLLREYLDLEFECLHDALPFGYSLERIIDDFVFMCYFVGNDFLPHLPYLDIADNALNRMFDIYKSLLPSLGDYLTDCGDINLALVEQFIQQLCLIEKEVLDELEHELACREKASRSRHGGRNRHHSAKPNDTPQSTSSISSYESSITDTDTDIDIEDEQGADDDVGDSVISTAAALHHHQLEAFEFSPLSGPDPHAKPLEYSGIEQPNAATSDDDDWKNRYYLQKFGHPLSDIEFHTKLRQAYIEGLAWVLKYYYDGCVSWGWFFPFHYAPLASGTCRVAVHLVFFMFFFVIIQIIIIII